MHSIVLLHDDTVFATGFNEYGQLGDGTNTNRRSFVQVIMIVLVVINFWWFDVRNCCISIGQELVRLRFLRLSTNRIYSN